MYGITKDEAIAELREVMPVGTKVYTILRKCASSGMSRNISVVVIDDGRPRDVSWLVLAAGIGRKPVNNGEGVRVSGCGMDMGFALVYDLAWTLHNDGYSLSHSWL
jgi:hypothetical protein